MLRQRSAPTKRSTTRRGRTKSKLSAAKKTNTSQNGIRRLESFRRLHLSAKRRASAKKHKNKEISNAKSKANKTNEQTFTKEFIKLIYKILIPCIEHAFRGADINPISNGHTNHLFQVGLPEPFVLNNRGFKKEYSYVIEMYKCKIIIVLGPRNFTIFIVPYIQEHNKNTHNYDEGSSNTISITYQATRGMYIYGVKSLNEPRISGSILNSCMFDICKSMKIPNVFIADEAGPNCMWSDRIKINNFSILRVIVGKPTFYEGLPGHFFDPKKAEAEKKILEQTNEEDKAFIKEYLKLEKIDNPEGCDRINHITEQAIALLPDPKYPELTKYVMTPYQ
uniref:Uncharacterized protein n=1 Tax=viral metagenome TaxID=1070528 RepID=A0A6C0ET67_9ZZZZ